MIAQLIRAASMVMMQPCRNGGIVADQQCRRGDAGPCNHAAVWARSSLMIDWEMAQRHPDSIVTAVEMMTARVMREAASVVPILVEHEAPASRMDLVLRGAVLAASLYWRSR
jgi:hypothetical protein